MFWELVYKIWNPELHKQLRKMGRFTYRFFKFWCETVFTLKRSPSDDFLSSFFTLIWVYQYLHVHSLEVIRWIVSYRTSLGKYIDNTALMTLPALTCVFEWRQNSWDLVIQMSRALRISVHLAVQWCPLSWKFWSKKKDKVFLKRL